MKAKVVQADAHELVWKADRARLQHTIRDLRAAKLQKQVDRSSTSAASPR